MASNDERRPLITQTNNSISHPPQYTSQHGFPQQETSAYNHPQHHQNTIPEIGADEMPPPYVVSNSTGSIPTINCKVCLRLINIDGKTSNHVVKCTVCNEATPIKTAPAGKKYVRCPCNCLLICKASSQRVSCPRENCKRVITLSSYPTTAPPSENDVVCVHCRHVFYFDQHMIGLAICPHCNRTSAIGTSYIRKKYLWFLYCAILMFIIFIICITCSTTIGFGGYWLLLVYAPLALSVSFLCKSLRYFCIPRSSSVRDLQNA